MRRTSYLALLTLLALGACQRRSSAPLPDVEKPLDLLNGPTLAGPPVDVGALRGKVVVVSFWSPS